MFITVISISCTFAEDASGTSVGTTDNELSDNPDESVTAVITLDDIEESNVDQDIEITGKVSDNEGIPISGCDLNVSLSERAYGDEDYLPITSEIVKTDANGAYSYSYMPKTGGQLNITVNCDDAQSVTKSIFVAPKSTVVTLDSIEDINLGDGLTLHGRLTDCDGNVLRDTGVGVLITGIAYGDTEESQYIKEYTRTDNDGFYTYQYKASVGGSLDVCVYYPGYHYYRFNRTDSHIWVMPIATKVSINPIDNSSKDKVEISGTLTDVDDNPLRYTSVGILFNAINKTYVKTDSTGSYNFSYRPLAGNNTVTVYYPGYHNYRFNKTEAQFEIVGKEAKVFINFINDLHVGDDIILSGKVTDQQNNPLTGRNVEVILPKQYNDNMQDYHIITPVDDDGQFEACFEYFSTFPLAGEIEITVHFIGDYEYNSYFETVTFSYEDIPDINNSVVGAVYLTNVSDNPFNDSYLDFNGKYNFYDDYKFLESFYIYDTNSQLFTENGVELILAEYNQNDFTATVEKSLLTNGVNLFYPCVTKSYVEYVIVRSRYGYWVSFNCTDVGYLEIEKTGDNVKVIDYSISKSTD